VASVSPHTGVEAIEREENNPDFSARLATLVDIRADRVSEERCGSLSYAGSEELVFGSLIL
jgi:hypothetical protein